MVGSELHQDRLISTAVTGDAGKVTTPSGVTPATGVLRKLLVTELDADSVPADAGKVWTPSSVTNDLPTLRFLSATEVDSLPAPTHVEVTDLGTAETCYSVLAGRAETVDIYVVLYGAITGTNETVTITIGGATPIPVTVLVAGSGAGVITSSLATTLSAAQSQGALITATTAGNSTGPTRARVVIIPKS